MTAEIGARVRWGKSSPTRLGYKASDIGKVIGVYNGRSGGDELDVEFADGDVIRGAFEEWFENVQLGTKEESECRHRPLLNEERPDKLAPAASQ